MSIEQIINSEIESKIDAKLRETFAEFISVVRTIKETPEVMTIKQLAEYWQSDEKSIRNWTRRTSFPLPVHYVGGNPRYHKIEVDSWSKLNSAPQLAKERKAA